VQKMAEPTEMPLTLVGPKNHVLDLARDHMNPFVAAGGEKSAMRPFATLLWTLIYQWNLYSVNTSIYDNVVKDIAFIPSGVCHIFLQPHCG